MIDFVSFFVLESHDISLSALLFKKKIYQKCSLKTCFQAFKKTVFLWDVLVYAYSPQEEQKFEARANR